ncbi:MAG TPA: hypothetical protein VFY32_12150 [Solirubrobacteraceae bacterium]|nr:hypothetical protein [Solirubrobacteraceae bacterium]
MRYRAAGKGAWITVYTNPGHAFAVIAGLRLDTSAAGDPPAARARAGARTCARRAATGRATPSACSSFERTDQPLRRGAGGAISCT